MKKTLDISVVIGTHNRQNMILDCLRSLENQNDPSELFEILVIDNASTDLTKKLVLTHLKKSKVKIRYIFEQKLGHSMTRNRGIQESEGNLIAFLDDDARAERNWLHEISSSFKKSSTVMAVGGKIIPQTTVPIPDWIPEHVLPLLTFVDYGEMEKQIHPPQTPVGTNMAFRKVVFEEIGLFNTNLGRKGTRLLSGEENDFFLRMKEKNLCVWYNPDAIVYHALDSQRFTKKYIRSRVFWEGVTWSKLIALHERHVHLSEY